MYHREKKYENNPLFCRIGKDKYTLPPTYFLTGDSMSYRYAFAFDAIAGSGVYASIGDTCPTTLMRPDSPKMSVTAAGGYRCWLFHQHVFNYINNSATTIKKVFVVSNWVYKLNDKSYLDVIYAAKEYAALNIALYLVEQPPVQPLQPKVVIANLKRLNNYTDASIRANSLSAQKFFEYDTKMYQPFLKRVQENTTVPHIYNRNFYCDRECCPMGTTKGLYYDDDVHIVPSRSLLLCQLFLSIL
jgi:hypothetical protein